MLIIDVDNINFAEKEEDDLKLIIKQIDTKISEIKI